MDEEVKRAVNAFRSGRDVVVYDLKGNRGVLINVDHVYLWTRFADIKRAVRFRKIEAHRYLRFFLDVEGHE